MNSQDRRTRPYALEADEGWIYRFGVDFIVKAGEIQEGSGVALLEYVTRKGEEPQSHIHKMEDEIFYIVEGDIRFSCGGETFDLKKGGFMFLPRGIEHGYTILSDEPVRLIVITAPTRERAKDGWGGFVSDMELGQGELIAKPNEK